MRSGSDERAPRHRRHSIRLQGYDYSEVGGYFVTICTQARQRLFGKIVGGSVRLVPAGRMTSQSWQELPAKFPQIELDEFIVMPDHFHGILIIPGLWPNTPEGQTNRSVPLGSMIQWFKTMTTNRYIRGVEESAWPRFSKKVWQRNYYEHVIRDEEELNQCRKYIIENPLKWGSGQHESEAPEWLSTSPGDLGNSGRTHRCAPTKKGRKP